MIAMVNSLTGKMQMVYRLKALIERDTCLRSSELEASTVRYGTSQLGSRRKLTAAVAAVLEYLSEFSGSEETTFKLRVCSLRTACPYRVLAVLYGASARHFF